MLFQDESRETEEDDQIMEYDSSSKRVLQIPETVSKRPRSMIQLEGISGDHPDAQTTTLLKAVNYESIDQICYDAFDEKNEINMAVKRLEADPLVRHPNGRTTGLYTNYNIQRLRIGGCVPGPNPISAGPVLEVVSFSMHKETTNNPKREDFGMCGKISLTDYQGNAYFIYNCPLEDPEHVFEGKDLFLSTCPIAPVMGPKVKFSLIDVDSPDPLFKEDTNYYLDESLACEKIVSQEFDGEGDNVARIAFKKTPHAVIVELDFYLEHEPPPTYQGEPTYIVSGVIKANNIVCWESAEGEIMTCGETCSFSQCRSAFAVPIETPTEVTVSFSSTGGMQYNGTFKVPPKYFFGPPRWHNFAFPDTDFRFYVEIDSTSHDDFFGLGGRGDSYLDRNWNSGVPKSFPTAEERSCAIALVEVFSVLLCGGHSSVAPLLCGQIIVNDGQGTFYIFARNKKCPDKCLSNEQRFQKTLSLAWPDDKWVLEKDFYMHLRLKDERDEPVCKGYLSWNRYDPRFDVRLCDVIQGERGYYVAVHYSVFLNGKKAKVSVKCSSSDSGDHQDRLVYGSIFAEYDNYDDYRSSYDKECYRIIIFKRTEEDCVNVQSGCEIPLAKSHVSAPSDCGGLFIDIDMCVVSCTDRSYEHAIGKLVFKAGCSTPQVKSCGNDLGLVVEVEWVSSD